MILLLQEYTSTTSVESILKLIGLLILCILIIAASFWTTKFVGKKQMGVQGKSNFKSLDVYRVNQNKYLQLVQIGTRYIVIAVSKDNISMLLELSEEDITYWRQEGKSTSFKDVLASIGKKKGSTDVSEAEEDKKSE